MFVVCKLPNAGELINGIAFRAMPGVGMVSVERVPQEALERLLRIPGYEALEDMPGVARAEREAAKPEPAPADAAGGRRRRGA